LLQIYSMIQITQKGLIISENFQLQQYQKEFAEKQCIVLPQLITQSLLEKIVKCLQTASFRENQHLTEKNKIFATDLTIDGTHIALHQINFLLNNSKLFNLIENITNCQTISSFNCRIYKNLPSAGHHLNWHDDTIDHSRLIGVSMNIGAHKYLGGKFQLRRKGEVRLLREVSCGNLGDTHIFNVANHLEHRVTETEGDFPRVAAAGWFTNQKQSFLNKHNE
jgi:hypothetical protein